MGRKSAVDWPAPIMGARGKALLAADRDDGRKE